MNKQRKGFTLVELVVVMVIIAILAGAAILGYNSFTRSARVTRAKSEHQSLVTAVQMWITDHQNSDGSVAWDKFPTGGDLYPANGSANMGPESLLKYLDPGKRDLLKLGTDEIHKVDGTPGDNVDSKIITDIKKVSGKADDPDMEYFITKAN